MCGSLSMYFNKIISSPKIIGSKYHHRFIASPAINPGTFEHIIFEKRCKNKQWRKDSLFNKWCLENWTTTCKRMKLEHFQTPCTKVNSIWIERPKCKARYYKLLEENISRTFFDITCTRILFDPPSRVIENKNKNNEIGPNETSKLLHSKGNHKLINRIKKQPSDWEEKRINS